MEKKEIISLFNKWGKNYGMSKPVLIELQKNIEVIYDEGYDKAGEDIFYDINEIIKSDKTDFDKVKDIETFLIDNLSEDELEQPVIEQS